MVTGLPFTKTLIEYNSNCLEYKDEKEKKLIDIELNEQNARPENDENAIDFSWSGVQEEEYEEDIVGANFIKNYKSKLTRKFFSKKVNGRLFDDCGILSIEKKN